MADTFFPPFVFRDKGLGHDFTATWYSRHLQTMLEPSFHVLSQDSKLHCYRFLWLRTFHQPITVRLDIGPNNAGLLTAKITDGQGGYESGRLIFNDSSDLTQNQVDTFLTALQELDFWNLPTLENANYMVIDGSQWILEGVKNGRYHLLDRSSPSEGPFTKANLMLTQFADITVQNLY